MAQFYTALVGEKPDEKPQTVKSLGINKRAIDTTIYIALTTVIAIVTEIGRAIGKCARQSHITIQMADKFTAISLATVIAIGTAIGIVICKAIGKLARQSQKAGKFKNIYQAQPIGAATVVAVGTVISQRRKHRQRHSNRHSHRHK
jgi:hypothetical protein